ncbi:MAG: ROK family protein [Bacteroidales bacterium]|nr:ROK family protein [Bacteroidales bacterium]
MINLFNPDTIVIGGLLARTEDYLLLPVKGAVKKHSLNIMSKDTHIVLSKIKEKAGVMGACLTARDRNY